MMNLCSMRDAPSNPFAPFQGMLLPAETAAMQAATTLYSEMVVAANPAASADGFAGMAKNPELLRSLSRIVPPEKARRFDEAAYAAERLKDDGRGLRYARALIAAGAALMTGQMEEDKGPKLFVEIPDPVVTGSLATMKVPAEWWFRLWAVRAGWDRSVGDVREGNWIQEYLGDTGWWRMGTSEIKKFPPPSRGAEVVDTILSGGLLTVSARISDDGREAAITAGPGSETPFTQIDTERALACLLGIKYLFGLIPWATDASKAARESQLHVCGRDITARRECDSLIIDHAGATVVFLGVRGRYAEFAGHDDRDYKPPDVPISGKTAAKYTETVTVHTSLGRGGGAPAAYRWRDDTYTITRPAEGALAAYPWREGTRLHAIRRAFLDRRTFVKGVDWRSPVLDIAAKLALAASSNARAEVTALAPPSRGMETFWIRTDEGVFTLHVVNSLNPRKRYAVLTNREGGRVRPRRWERGYGVAGNPWHLAVGPSGNLGYLSGTALVDEADRMPSSPAASSDIRPYVTTIEFWPEVMTQLPVGGMFRHEMLSGFTGALSEIHPGALWRIRGNRILRRLGIG